MFRVGIRGKKSLNEITGILVATLILIGEPFDVCFPDPCYSNIFIIVALMEARTFDILKVNWLCHHCEQIQLSAAFVPIGWFYRTNGLARFSGHEEQMTTELLSGAWKGARLPACFIFRP